MSLILNFSSSLSLHQHSSKKERNIWVFLVAVVSHGRREGEKEDNGTAYCTLLLGMGDVNSSL